jgi:hypothetical protein
MQFCVMVSHVLQKLQFCSEWCLQTSHVRPSPYASPASLIMCLKHTFHTYPDVVRRAGNDRRDFGHSSLAAAAFPLPFWTTLDFPCDLPEIFLVCTVSICVFASIWSLQVCEDSRDIDRRDDCGILRLVVNDELVRT